MNGADIIRDVSLDLNDQEPGHEYTRWTQTQLQTYLREALIQVSASVRSWFTKRMTVEVLPGADWQEVCSCSEIIRLVGETNAKDRLIRYLHKYEDSDTLTWVSDVDSCVDPSAYKMSGYMVSNVDKSLFRVIPTIPGGQTRFVRVECFARPDGALESDVPDDAMPMVKQWMLYRALSVDSENNSTITQLANTHKETFFSLLKMAVELDERDKRDGRVRNAPQQAAE